jgi:type II secretory pathway pseudopilin PulG
MNLEANASRIRGHDGQCGYAMAALLVAMAVMAVLMTVAMPTWKQMMQREKEEELIFRGTQYARAIGAYQRKYANASPPTIDVLIEQHFLRKKYKDPLAPTQDGEFAPLYVSNQNPGSPGGQGGPGGQSSTAGTLASTTPSGGIIGVASKNTGESLRTYNDHHHYNEWQFIALQQSTRAGGPGQNGAAGAGGGPPNQGGQGTPSGQGRQGTQGTQGTQGSRGSQGNPQQGGAGSQGRGGVQPQGR